MDDALPELKAMAEIASLFASLEKEEIHRVLKWANEKYHSRSASSVRIDEPALSSIILEKREFGDFPALFDAVKPSNGLERILAGAYYYQIVKGEPDFDSQSLNSELKHLGYPSSNITRDIESLVNRIPKLVIQTRKEGATQQARKKFRLTTEGIRTVEGMLCKTSETTA